MSAPTGPPPSISQAEAFLMTARTYRVGASTILTNRSERCKHSTDVRFVLPTVMLIGHSIEVYLKAWLSHHGMTEAHLRKAPYGHNLNALCAKAKMLGLSEPEPPQQYSFQDLVESFAEQHDNFSFRYPNDGWMYDVPHMDLVFSVLNDLDAVIGGAILGGNEVVPIQTDDNFRLLQR